MKALHRKLDVVLVQILPYNCSETDYIFARIRPPPEQDPPSTRMWVSPSDPFTLHYFSLRRPWQKVGGGAQKPESLGAALQKFTPTSELSQFER